MPELLQVAAHSPPTDTAVKMEHRGWKELSVNSQRVAVAPVREAVEVGVREWDSVGGDTVVLGDWGGEIVGAGVAVGNCDPVAEGASEIVNGDVRVTVLAVPDAVCVPVHGSFTITLPFTAFV